MRRVVNTGSPHRSSNIHCATAVLCAVREWRPLPQQPGWVGTSYFTEKLIATRACSMRAKGQSLIQCWGLIFVKFSTIQISVAAVGLGNRCSNLDFQLISNQLSKDAVRLIFIDIN